MWPNTNIPNPQMMLTFLLNSIEPLFPLLDFLKIIFAQVFLFGFVCMCAYTSTIIHM